MALPEQIFGFGSAPLFVPRGICGGQTSQRWSKERADKRKTVWAFYEAWRLLSVNKSNMCLGSAAVAVSPGILSWTWDMRLILIWEREKIK